MSRVPNLKAGRSIGRGRPAARRRYNTRLIRRDCCYCVQEIAELFGLHRNAIRRWLGDGLARIDELRPVLVHGTDLIAYLDNRQSARKRGCRPDEFYCCRCRAPRRARGGEVEALIRNARQLLIAATCELCGARMNRAGTVSRLSEYRATYSALTLRDRRLTGCADTNGMCHLKEVV